MEEGHVDAERLARAALSRAAADDPGVPADVWLRGAAAVWEDHRAAHPDVDPERDLDLAGRAGIRLLCPGDPQWPALLSALSAPASGAGCAPGEPLALWVRGPGDLAGLCASAVAVAGSRAAGDYGLHVAAEIGCGLAERGRTVVSRAAFGVDAAAHRGALAARGPTVAVLACGVDVAYPAAHADLLAQIADTGAVVSEHPPGTTPARGRFLARNRLVAGLSWGTVIVEAGLRGGTLNTARHAREFGRTVMAVPGPVTSATSAGCHRLLRDHRETRLVTCAAEVCEEVGEPVPVAEQIVVGGRVFRVDARTAKSYGDVERVADLYAPTGEPAGAVGRSVPSGRLHLVNPAAGLEKVPRAMWEPALREKFGAPAADGDGAGGGTLPGGSAQAGARRGGEGEGGR